MRLRALTALVLGLGFLTVAAPASAAETLTVFHDGSHPDGRACALVSSDWDTPGIQNGVVDGGPLAVPGGDPAASGSLVCSVQVGVYSTHAGPDAARVVSADSSGAVYLQPTTVSYTLPSDANVWVCTEVRLSGGSTLFWDDVNESWSTYWDAPCALAIMAFTPSPASLIECGDGIDNDGDGWTDHPDDPDCTGALDPSESPPPVRAACEDGTDNDGDGATDYPADPDCADPLDPSEDPPPPVALTACEDGVDNDGDGWTDHPDDPSCAQTRGTSEDGWPPASCPRVGDVVACAAYTQGTPYETFRVWVPRDTLTRVTAHVYRYDFTLPNGAVVSVPCVVLAGTTVDACAQAGGSRTTLVMTLVDDAVPLPTGPMNNPIVNVTLCHADLVLTVNDMGLKTFPAYALCGAAVG